MAESDRNNHIPAEDLSAYADGAYLSASERAEIEQHLASCAHCREELESLRAVSMLLSDLSEPEIPRSFRLTPEDAARASAEQETEPEPIQPWILRYQSAFRYSGLAAALLLVVVLTIDLFPEDDTDQPATLMEEPAVDVVDDEIDDDDVGIMVEDDEPAVDPDEEVMDEEEAVEEAAPEEDRDAIEDERVDDPAADEPADELAPAEAEEPDDQPVSEPDAADEPDDPVVEPEPTPTPPDDDVFETQVELADDDGLSTMQVLAIGLGLVSATLLTLGFIVPRWWGAAASSDPRETDGP